MDTSVISNTSLISQLKALHQKGLYRQELALAEQYWGSYQQWRNSQQLLIGGNLFANLGLRRIATAMRLHAWRKDQHNPEAIYYYVVAVYSRRGPLAALRLIKKFGDLPGANKAQQAKWLAFQASVYSQYRDWKTAHALIQQAQQLAPNHPMVAMEHAYVLEAEDRYQDAANVVAPLASRHYRPAVQFAAHLRTLADDRPGAIALLQPLLDKMESISLCLQLFRLYQQQDEMPAAERCLQRARQLIPDGSDALSQEFACAAYELAYRYQQYDEALTLLASIKAPFFQAVRENLEKADRQQKIIKLDVPFVRQHHMTCAPATLTAIARYWQQPAEHLEIVEEICYDGTPHQAERQWAIDQGWVIKEFELQPEVAYALLDRGVPFTLTTVAPGSAHLQAVIGYDPLQGLYLVRDPYYPSIQEFLIDAIAEQAKSTGPRCMVLVPADKAHLLEGIEFPAAPFYDINFALLNALKVHDRDQAVDYLKQLKNLDAEHRLTLLAERALARYDNNLLQELVLVERLQSLYPEDLNLQTEYAALLGKVGRHQQQIEFLREKTQEAYPHPYLVEALANCLRFDGRHHEETKRLLNYVIYRQPTNAFALFMLACTYWDQERYQEAFELYRLCACLEDKNEGYISSYFKAARFLKQTEQSLAELKERVIKLGKKSFYPYESLYFAHRALNLDQAALETLLEARKYHQNEATLIRRLAEIYLYNGMADEAEQVLQEGKPYLPITDWLELNSGIANHRNNWQQEKQFYEQILKHDPLHFRTIERLANLLAIHEDEAAAVKFIESRLEINPTDRDLLFLKLDWLHKAPLDEREAFARKIIAIHDQDAIAHLRLARILAEQAQQAIIHTQQGQSLRQQKLNEALQQAQTAYQINPLDTETLITYGDLHRRNEDFISAKKYYREAIRYSADTEDVFSRLLSCEESMEKKREQLQFIYDQLMEQTSYGNGILEYMSVARDLTKDEDLLTFLQEAVRLRPDLWQSWAALAMHLGTMNQLANALDVATQGVKRFPFLPRLLLERGRLYFMAQDFASAEQDLLNVLQISPQWIRAITLLADIYDAQNKYDDILALIQGALNHSPKSQHLYGYLADIYWIKGDWQKARAQLEKALSLDPYYDWAWDRHEEISQKLDQPDATLMLARNLRQQFPNNAQLWKILAEQETDTTKKLACIEQALKLFPRDEDYNLVKCRILFAENRFNDLQTFIHDNKWNGYPPPALLAFEAWAEAKYQRYDKAIPKMQEVVATYPNYYDGWRLLSQWQQATGQHEAAAQTVRKCVRLCPHNPSALTLAAETLLEASKHNVKVNVDEIDQWLKRAVMFNPRDQYNALTWLDFLIEQKNITGLDDAKQIIQFDHTNPYYQARLLQAALLENDQEQAIELFRALLVNSDKNQWLFDTAYEAFAKAKLFKQIKKTLNWALQQKNVNPQVGRLWMRHAFSQNQYSRKMLTVLQKVEAYPDIWLEALEEVFTPRNYGKFSEQVIKHYRKRLQGHGRLWSIVTFYYSRQRQWDRLRSWCRRKWQRNTNDAWAVYLYSYGLRLAGDWRLAAEVNQFASELPQDDYIDRILLWQLMDGALNADQPIDLDVVGRIRVPELSAFETYVYDLLQAMWLAKTNGLPTAAEQVVGILQQAKIEHQDLLQEKVTQTLKLRVRRYLYRTIQGGLWPQIIWRVRLFNLM